MPGEYLGFSRYDIGRSSDFM